MSATNQYPKCPVCEGELNKVQALDNSDRIDCPNCGIFELGEFTDELPTVLRNDRIKRSVLSHALRKMQRKGTPHLDPTLLDQLLAGRMPTVGEQCTNLIEWLRYSLPAPGDRVWIEDATHRAVVGAVSKSGFQQIIHHMLDRRLIDVSPPMVKGVDKAHATLSVEGWDSYESLLKSGNRSRVAFMAMPFNDVQLDKIFRSVLKPAVAAAGFELRRLDENPQAGLIDDRLRVEIRKARFLVADLSHDNAGAYWEAGFAEGLGKPVIYTCEASKFKDKKTHFDTNHHLTVCWSEKDVAGTIEELKATIRATLPAEAKMDDA